MVVLKVDSILFSKIYLQIVTVKITGLFFLLLFTVLWIFSNLLLLLLFLFIFTIGI